MKKGLRRLNTLITAQTMGNLDKLATMAGYNTPGRVIDKLVRDHMVSLRVSASAAAFKKANDAFLEEKWRELDDIPFDEHDGADMTLAENWWIFAAGAEREAIWRYFDETHSKGVAFLLYGEEPAAPRQKGGTPRW